MWIGILYLRNESVIHLAKWFDSDMGISVLATSHVWTFQLSVIKSLLSDDAIGVAVLILMVFQLLRVINRLCDAPNFPPCIKSTRRPTCAYICPQMTNP